MLERKQVETRLKMIESMSVSTLVKNFLGDFVLNHKVRSIKSDCTIINLSKVLKIEKIRSNRRRV